MTLRRWYLIWIPVLTLLLGTTSGAVAGFSNGNFLTNGSGGTITSGIGLGGVSGALQGWSQTSAYDFLYTSSAPTAFVGGVGMQGVNFGVGSGLNGYTGNYVAADADFGSLAPLSQTITGLMANTTYVTSFYWAVSQQAGYGSGSTAGFVVGFGNGATQSTGTQTFNGTFAGWTQVNFTFTTGNETSDTLSFTAIGSGGPPFALLAGVTFGPAAVPEPSTLILMGIGMVGFLGVGLRKRAKAIASASASA